MKKLYKSIAVLFTLIFILSINTSEAQIVVNELISGSTVELKNTGTEPVDVSSYWLCNFPDYQQMSDLNVVCGSLILAAGETVAIDDFDSFNEVDGEMGLYTTNSFSSSDAMIDYVEWGSTGHQRSSVAVEAGIWTTGDFAPAFSAGMSLTYDGTGDSSSDWSEADNSLCGSVLSVEETAVTSALSVEIYPNPTTSQFQIKSISNNLEVINIEIYNSLGEVVKILESVSSLNGLYTVDVTGLEAGNYMVSIYSLGEVYTTRIIKLP